MGLYLKRPILGLDGDDLVADQLEDTVDDGLEALEDLLVGKGHVPLLDASIRKVRLDAHVHRPLLAVVPEVGLDPVLKVHDALGVDLAGGARTVRQLHLADLGAQDVAEIAVQRGRTARVAGTGGAFGDAEGLLLLDFVGDQIDGATAAVDDQDGVADLQVEQAGLGAEDGGGLGLRDQGQTVVVLVPQEPRLEGGRTRGGLAGVVPDGRHGEVVSDVALLSRKYLTQGLLQLGAHGLAQLEEVVGGDIDFGLAGRQGREVDGVDVRVPGQHELQLEPFDLLHPLLRIAGGGERIRDIRAPTHDLLVLVIVEDGGDLQNGQRDIVSPGGSLSRVVRIPEGAVRESGGRGGEEE